MVLKFHRKILKIFLWNLSIIKNSMTNLKVIFFKELEFHDNLEFQKVINC